MVEERRKTFEQDGEMISEPGKRGVYDCELETLRDIYELAAFVATETFDVEIDPRLTLNIEGHGERTFTIDDAEREMTA